MKKISFLIGATDQGTIIIANLKAGKKLKIEFAEVIPFSCNLKIEKENIQKKINELNTDVKYELCEIWDCAPSKLADKYIENGFSHFYKVHSTKLYPKCINYDENTNILFEDSRLGQYDYRNKITDYALSKKVSEEIFKLWNGKATQILNQYEIEDIFDDIKKNSNEHKEEKWLRKIISRNLTTIKQ